MIAYRSDCFVAVEIGRTRISFVGRGNPDRSGNGGGARFFVLFDGSEKFSLYIEARHLDEFFRALREVLRLIQQDIGDSR